MGVPDYTNHIGGIDRSDHYCTTHFHMEISEVVEKTFSGAWMCAL
jgi:hypothetical protein